MKTFRRAFELPIRSLAVVAPGCAANTPALGIPHMAEVVTVSLTRAKGSDSEHPDVITLDDRGVVGDFHAGSGERQVSLLPAEAIERCAAETGRELGPGSFAENISSRGLDVRALARGDRLAIGDVILEVTKPSKPAEGEACPLHGPVDRFIMREDGIFCRVVAGGEVRPGDSLERV
jgi:molybdopterin adenylyltransferase